MPYTPYQNPFDQYKIQPPKQTGYNSFSGGTYNPPIQTQPKQMLGPMPGTWSRANTANNGYGFDSTPWDPSGIFSGGGTVSPTGAGPSTQNYTTVYNPRPLIEGPTDVSYGQETPISYEFKPPEMGTVIDYIAPPEDPRSGWPVEPGPEGMGMPPPPTDSTPPASPPASPPADPFNFTMDQYLALMGETNMPTMDQIQMDPSYKFQQQQGINAIDSSASARGGLLSSGHTKDILDYSQGLASQEYGKAYDRFRNNRLDKSNRLLDAFGMLSGNRAFGANRMDAANIQNNWQNTNDRRNYEYDDTTGYNRFKDQWNNYNDTMSGAQKTDSGLASMGPEAAGKMVDLITNSASSLVSMGLTAAQIDAMKTMAKSGQNKDILDSIFKMAGIVVPFLL